MKEWRFFGKADVEKRKEAPLPPGILYGYQKKGVADEGMRMVVKTKGLLSLVE